MHFSLRYIGMLSCFALAVAHLSVGQTPQRDTKHATPQTGGTADVQINACIAALPQYGGICDFRSFGATSQTVAAPIKIGPSPKRVELLLDARTLFNITDASESDIFAVGDGSSVVCDMMGEAANFGGEAGMYLAATAKVKSIIASAPRNGWSIFITKGCTLLGNPSATVTGALLDVQGTGASSTIEDTTIVVNGPFIGFRAQPGTSTGMSDLTIWNLTSDSGGYDVTGAQPCVIQGSGATQQVSNITFFGGSCQHAGPNEYELKIDGQNDGSGAVPGVSGIFFAGTWHMETAVPSSGPPGSLGIKINDAANIKFDGADISGAGVVSDYTISESVPNLVQDIEIGTCWCSSGSLANYIVNTAAGGKDVPNVNSPPYEQQAYMFKAGKPPVGAVAGLTPCSAGTEGQHSVATNCNAACLAGHACTAGGTVHCELYCNGTSLIETGR
ncbi:MAG TPA: hypothetical protein VIW68_12350 [Candidatus Sulfotelmatobacter sp.]